MNRENHTTEDLERIYAAARWVADIVHHSAQESSHSGRGPLLEDRRTNPPHAWGDQVLGLCLNVAYGWPTSLLTPWGQWDFAVARGHATRDQKADLVDRVLEPLRTSPFDIGERTSLDDTGPVHAILRVGDIDLPHPTPVPDDQRLEDDEALDAWNRLTRRYRAERRWHRRLRFARHAA